MCYPPSGYIIFSFRKLKFCGGRGQGEDMGAGGRITQRPQINKEDFARMYKNNDKSKNTGRPEVVVNQYSENKTVYPCKRIVFETNSYSNTLSNSQTNSRNIKFFSDSIPKGIRIKQMNQQIKNGNACIHSFPGATSYQLLHYLDASLDKYTDTVVVHIGINDI